MTEPALHLDLITARFPDQAMPLRRLCLADPSFRGLCEEYGLARTCLSRFESLGREVHATEIRDYQSVIAELEGEIAKFLAKSGERHSH